MPENALATFTGAITSAVTTMFDWFGAVFAGILGNPILLFLIGISLVPLVIRLAMLLFKKLKRGK